MVCFVVFRGGVFGDERAMGDWIDIPCVRSKLELDVRLEFMIV